MIDTLLSYLAPHYCCGCGQIGSVICDNCKYNITSESFYACFSCGNNLINEETCAQCILPYQRAWCVGERSGVLKRAIGEFKFYHKRATYKDLADMMCDILPELPPETVIVYVPTVASHIRVRGFDHVRLLAERIAKSKGVKVSKIIKRKASTTQRNADRETRDKQAKRAFAVEERLSPTIPYLLIDDVVTTGSTLLHSARELRSAGAEQIWVLALAYQALD